MEYIFTLVKKMLVKIIIMNYEGEDELVLILSELILLYIRSSLQGEP